LALAHSRLIQQSGEAAAVNFENAAHTCELEAILDAEYFAK
jgi:hypothetical protein